VDKSQFTWPFPYISGEEVSRQPRVGVMSQSPLKNHGDNYGIKNESFTYGELFSPMHAFFMNIIRKYFQLIHNFR
jgi:hypothetical protein